MGERVMTTMGRASSLSARLRLLQVDLAHESEQTREDELRDELSRQLDGFSPEEREGVLLELMRQFPAWDPRLDEAADEGAVGSARSAEHLIENLEREARGLSASERRAMADRLERAGFVSTMASSAERAAAMELDNVSAALGLNAGSELSGSRVSSVLCALIEFAGVLDKAGWTFWKSLVPESRVRRRDSLPRVLAAYLQGDGEVGREQVRETIGELEAVCAALMYAASAAPELMRERLAPLDPSQIEAAAGTKGGLLRSRGDSCWEASRTAWNACTDGDIAQAVRKQLGRSGEAVFRERIRKLERGGAA